MKQERRTYLAFKITSHRRKMKIRAVEYKGGKCEMCGYDKCISAMEFHHPDPKKKDFHISHGSYGWEKIQIAKCQLLCCRCHREVHDFSSTSSISEREKTELIRLSAKKESAEKRKIHSRNVKEVFSKLKFVRENKWPSIDLLSKIIWEKPITVVAKEIGVSDKAVKKRCQKFGINTPGPGHWSKFRSHGK